MTCKIKIIIVFFFIFINLHCSTEKPLIIKINDVEISVEVAFTPKQRAQGLMYREVLAKNAGMLFVFPEDLRLAFWMKNTSLPLSIAYIAADGQIKEIYTMEPYSLTPVQGRYYARMALEVNRGFFKNNNIKVGDYLIIPRLAEKYPAE